MKGKKPKDQDENPLKDLDKIELKGFKELEDEDLKNFDLDDFKKSRLSEFKEREFKEFKNYVKESKDDRNIEELKLKLKSDDALKNTLKELDSIGIDGTKQLKLLERIKKGFI